MSMLRTNESSLVEVSVGGEVWPAAQERNQYRATSEGLAATHMGMAGICFTHRAGDYAFGWEGDHLEPCVSVRNSNVGAEHALHFLTCIGNEAVITSGECTGKRGVITGEHAHILADFPPSDIEMLAVGDKIQIRSIGTGLRLLDYPEIILHKMSPGLLAAMDVKETPVGIEVPVVMELPSHLMGSGCELSADYVDQDLMTGDRELMHTLGIDQLRIGDIVLVRDQDDRWGRGFLPGAVTIGLVIHGDSAWTGHGPGILDLMACRTSRISPVIDPQSNVALRLGLRSEADLAAGPPAPFVSSYAQVLTHNGRSIDA